MDVYCIADEDTVRGFRLAGVEGDVVATPREAVAALERAARRGVHMVILTHEVAAAAREEVDTIRATGTEPLIVEIPGPEGPMPGRKTLREFVQEAVGIRVGQEESE